MKKLLSTVMICVGCSQLLATTYTYNFNVLAPNSAESAAYVESYITMDVTGVIGSLGVTFRFSNLGTSGSSSITDIYFQDPPPNLNPPPTTTTPSGSGVVFNQEATPKNKPGGSIDWGSAPVTQYTIGASPVDNGVNPGEWIEFYFEEASFNDVLSYLNEDAWHTAVHVQSLQNGKSEWGESNDEGFIPKTPDGGITAILLGLGVLGLGYFRNRKA